MDVLVSSVASTPPTTASEDDAPVVAWTPRTTLIGGRALFESEALLVGMADDARLAIENKLTAERYGLGGQGLLTLDDGSVLQFWGTTSFVFDDGTKLTLQIPFDVDDDKPAITTATIVHGDYGVQIRASDQAPLAIDERPQGGAALDAGIDDGNRLIENALGEGFVALGEDGTLQLVDQDHLDATDLVRQRQLAWLLERLWLSAFNAVGFVQQVSMRGLLRLQPPPPPWPRDEDRPPPEHRSRQHKPLKPIYGPAEARERLVLDECDTGARVVERRPSLRVLIVGYEP